MTDFQKDGILQRLMQLDDDALALFGLSQRFEITIVGGSALIITRLTPDTRFTTDIDVLKASQELEQLLERYDMNMSVSTFLYQYPHNWEKRRRPIPFDGQVIDVYTLSNEDLVITKLLAWRRVDKHDLTNMLATDCIDFDKLKSIIDDVTELRINLEDEEWNAFFSRYLAFEQGELT